MDVRNKIAKSIYVGLGGNPTDVFDNTEDIYNEIDRKFEESGSRITVESLELNVTENGEFVFDDEKLTGYKPVSVSVNIDTQESYNDGYNDGKTDGYSEGSTDGYNNGYGHGYETGNTEGYTRGYSEGSTDGYESGYQSGSSDGYASGVSEQKNKLQSITLDENGRYEREDGWNEVIVDVEIPVFETETLSINLNGNGQYNYTPTKDGYSSVSVNVSVGESGKPKIYNGFQFTGGDIAQVDFSQYDWSNVYDTSNFFQQCNHSTGDWSNFLNNYNGKILSGHSMFSDCSDLTTIPQLDTSNVTNMSRMFYYCKKLLTIPQLDTSNVTDMGSMFANCYVLTSIPQLDTSNVTDMGSMFYCCGDLTTIPQLDTSNVADMNTMFCFCCDLTTIPQLDTSNVTDMGSMFANCYVLTSIPQLDTSNVMYMDSMFSGCSDLTAVPKLYCGRINSGTRIDIFSYSTMTNLTDLGGFEDLGKISGFSKPNYFLKNCPNLTKESVMNVINNLYDRKTAGYSVVTLPFNTNSLALLSDEEKAIATNKGWTLATS